MALRIHFFFEDLTGSKGNHPSRGDGNFFTRSRIPSLTLSFASHHEISKPRNFHGLAFAQHVFHAIQDVLHQIHGLGFGNAYLFTDVIGNVGFTHRLGGPCSHFL